MALLAERWGLTHHAVDVGGRCGLHRRHGCGWQVPVQPMDGKCRVACHLDACDPARQEDARCHAHGKRQLAGGQVSNEEEKEDRCGHVNIPESNLPLVIKAARDVGVGLHRSDRMRARGLNDRAHDGAGNHQTYGGEDGQANIEQHRTKITQGRQRYQRDHEANKAD